MATKAFEDFIRKADNLFNAMQDDNYSDLLDQINDLNASLGDIKIYTATAENDGHIGANIVVCELIIELLFLRIDMKSEFLLGRNNFKKINNLNKIREETLKIVDKLEGADNSDGKTVNDGIMLILSNVKDMSNLSKEFANKIYKEQKERSERVENVERIVNNLDNEVKKLHKLDLKSPTNFAKVEKMEKELKEARSVLKDMKEMLGTIMLKNGGSKRTKRKTRRSKKSRRSRSVR